MAVKKTQMYRRNLDGTETNLNPLTEAQYVSMENGQTVQEVLSDRDSDKYTPVITNSSSTFKVGQGDNVDLSSSMKEGAYDSCVFKGKTMVNCIQEPSSKDVVLPYEFADGQYVTINDTKESGALGVELKGQTLVNCVDLNSRSFTGGNTVDSSGIITLKGTGGWSNTFIGYKAIKPNTKYLIRFNIIENSIDGGTVCLLSGASYSNVVFDSVHQYINAGDVGTYNYVFTSKADLTGTSVGTRSFLGSGSTTGQVRYTVMILEYQEGMENWDIPYFTDMTSCKMPTLHTVGSLFDAQKIIANNTFTYSHSTNIGRFEFTNRGDVVVNTNIQLPAGTYDISFLIRGVCDNGRVAITFAKDGQVWHNCSRVEINYGEFGSTTFKEVKSQRTFDAPVTVTLAGHAWAGGATGSGWCEFKDIRFTPVGKTSILSLPEEVVLRSLPNGACDTFNTRTGVYTQRIKEKVLNGDGSESWVKSGSFTGTSCIRFQLPLSDAYVSKNTIISITNDKFPNYPNSSWQEDVEQVNIDISNRMSLNILKTKLSSEDVSGVRTWLSQNPVKIQYELKTPIVIKINLSSTLKSWNTTTHIYSEIPENTLYPTLSHSNPTYPVILKPSTKYSIVANSYSNNHTNSAINFILGGATASTTVGNRVTTITTPSTLSNELLTMSGRGNKLNNVMVIEGDVVGDEPYFEGICDCKSPILSNVGKNLFDVNGEWHKSTYSHAVPMLTNGSQTITTLENGVQITTNNNQYHGGFGQFINIGGINKLRIAFTGEYTDTKTHPEIVVQLLRKGEELPKTMNGTLANTDYNPRKTSFKLSRSGETVSKVISTQGYECAYVHLCGGYLASMSGTYTFVAKNICIEDADQVDIYEPYKSNILSFNQNDDKTIVLRSLPSGVCDTLNVETGEYVQNVVDVVLDGTENWTLNNWGTDDNFCSFEISSLNNAKIQNVYKQNSYINFYCDTFRVLTNCKWNYMGEKHIRQWSDGNRTTISVIIPKSELKTYDVTGFIEYLTKNNIRINIRANNPIVSTIDVQGFPYAYTNGHVQLSSGSIEQSLTPKVEYSLSANKTGQINSNTKRVSAHQKQLDDFEAMMLTQMVQSAYDKAILQFDYEMQMMSLGGE